MLVLSRKANEVTCIGDDIEVVVLAICGQSVKLGIKAPREIPVVRTELQRQTTGESVDPGSRVILIPLKNCPQIASADEAGEQLLHQFCQRRNSSRMPEAIQTLCISAMAQLVAVGGIVGAG